ncbi:MAG TPA: type III-A CRISPR-associated RAMP protein Csm3 [Ignavibacteria bacterium]|nr:type III-A CRISPR-associated RAMP protein Csm3 [Ignavibacteria bacterium]HRK00460.1 type III-A CRISPR-associated RAMP protein Csm3 [Ignavibacteria bacterium]
MKIHKKKYKIIIETLTGLHIGIGNDKLQIGGVDSEVIKDPVTKQPYIPGSSLKGKIRCLLETEGDFEDGERNKTLNLCFGINNDYKKIKDVENKNRKKNGEPEVEYRTPTRFIFRDLFLIEEDEKRFQRNEINTEFKTEIVIDRQKGTAKDGGLRTIERVPPKVRFEGNIIIRYLENEKVEDLFKVLESGVNLLIDDCLGGSGSRGYGAVKVSINEIN